MQSDDELNTNSTRIEQKNKKNVDKFYLFKSYWECSKDLKNATFAKFWRGVFEYCFEGVEPQLSREASFLFKAIKPNLDSSLKIAMRGKRNIKKTDNLASFCVNDTQSCTVEEEVEEEEEEEKEIEVGIEKEDVCVNKKGNQNALAHKFISALYDDLSKHSFPCNCNCEAFTSDFAKAVYDKHLPVDVVCNAFENYLSVFDDPDCYPSTVYTIDGFIKSPFFDQCNVSNFNKDNFLKFGLDKPQDLSKGLPGWPLDCVR